MAHDETADDGLASGIIGSLHYSPSTPTKKEFLPWHRPRKQFVRDGQWKIQIESLLAEMGTNVTKLKYLGLPGVDLIDIRYFHQEICRPRSLPMYFLGFNKGAAPQSEAQVELNVSLSEVRNLEWIDPISQVIQDDLKLVGRHKSVAYRETKKHAPYDIVNLDLCDGFAIDAPGDLELSHYDAVNTLLTLQARNPNQWILLLTTRIGNAHINSEVLKRLSRNYCENLSDCEPFRAASSEHFHIATEDDVQEALGDDEGLANIFVTGVCKWLLGCVLAQSPQTTIDLKSVIGYRVDSSAEHEDLVSMAIKFKPSFIPPPDPLGLAGNAGIRVNECEISPGFIRRVNSRRDADAILDADPELRASMEEATGALLEQARYAKADYSAWVAKGCPPTTSHAP